MRGANRLLIDDLVHERDPYRFESACGIKVCASDDPRCACGTPRIQWTRKKTTCMVCIAWGET